MNKNLIALAVAGAFIAPAAMAQTANPVVLYGQVNVTAESVEARGQSSATPAAASLSRRSRIEDQSSRLGVRGTEDLGGDLKAFFQLETAFRPDSNNTTFAARNSAVGLQGGWGSVLIGRWDMPFKSAAIAIDPWGDITIAGLTGVMSDRTNFDRRDQNVAQYWSPTWAGLAFRLAATANERKNDPAGVNAHDTGANVTWTRGGIYLFYAYEEHKDNNNGNAFAPSTTNGIAGYKETGQAIGGSFVFGPIKLGAGYHEFKKTSRTKEKSWMGNVVWTIGNNQIIGQYMNSKDGQLSTSALEAPDCDSTSIGYKYNFSRRTSFIAHYVDVKNNSTATCNFGSNTLAIGAGQDPRGVAVGFLHNF
jgi:predicted porin